MDTPIEKQTVIITGSNGFIGNAIIKRLAQRYNVVGFDLEIPAESLSAKNYEVNIASAESISKALDDVRVQFGNKIASVIHLAAYYSFAEKESPKYDSITVKGTEHFIQLLKSFEVEQFIFSSTMLVHKSAWPGQKITEETPLSPSWAYPKSKVRAETILKQQHENVPLVILRIAGVYDDRCHSIPIANQIMRIYEKHLTSRLYPGDVRKGQSFLHLSDLVDAIEKTVEKRASLPKELDLLIGEPTALSYSDMQNKIGCLLHGREWSSLKIPSWFAKTGSWLQQHTPMIRKPFIMPWMIDFADDHYDLDITRAEKMIDWKPKHELQKSLPTMLEALKDNPLQWYKENKLKEPSNLARVFGRMPGEINGFEVPSKNYIHQLNGCNLMNILWGFWLLFECVTHATNMSMLLSSIISSILVILFSTFAFWFLWQWPRWLSAAIGVWILFAPLAFWTSSAADYSTANLLGFLIIFCGAFQPNKQEISVPLAMEAPPGWDYNPSSWHQRIPIIALALSGFFIARYMAAFQLGHINSVWDPLFEGQTAIVLKSDVSKSFPVSDAGLGAIAYLLDAVSGLIGDKHRWRTMPWMVLFFGVMIIPSGVTSIALVILQPVAVNAWCFLCLLTAFIMLLMVSPALDEVVATLQFLRQSHKEGKSFWRTFFHGEAVAEIALVEFESPMPSKTKPNLPMPILGSVLMSACLMFLPTFLSIEKPASTLIYFSAALIFTFSVIAMSEISRPLRFLNMGLGIILALGIWFLGGAFLEAKLLMTLVGLFIFLLSFPSGKFRHHFGSYDKLARF